MIREPASPSRATTSRGRLTPPSCRRRAGATGGGHRRGACRRSAPSSGTPCVPLRSFSAAPSRLTRARVRSTMPNPGFITIVACPPDGVSARCSSAPRHQGRSDLRVPGLAQRGTPPPARTPGSASVEPCSRGRSALGGNALTGRGDLNVEVCRLIKLASRRCWDLAPADHARVLGGGNRGHASGGGPYRCWRVVAGPSCLTRHQTVPWS